MPKTILAVLEAPQQAQAFVESVLAMAEYHGAHVVFVVLSAAPMLTPTVAPFGGMYVIPGELRGMRQEDRQALQAMLPPGCAHEILAQADDVGFLPADVRKNAPPADLIVIGGRAHWDVEWLRRHVTETLLLSSGTPVLLLPAGRSLRKVDHVVLGWKPGAPAVRALHAAIAIAAAGARLDVVNVYYDAPDIPKATLEPVAAMLERHGFAVATHHLHRTASVGETLTTFALDEGADLLATGGYGHSRAREIFLGGVTRSFVDDCRLPVLLTH